MSGIPAIHLNPDWVMKYLTQVIHGGSAGHTLKLFKNPKSGYPSQTTEWVACAGKLWLHCLRQIGQGSSYVRTLQRN